MKKTKQNLVVSIDSTLTGDTEVMAVRTTASDNIVIAFKNNATQMDVHIDDLQDAINQLRVFLEQRGVDKSYIKPMSENQMLAAATIYNAGVNKEKELEDSIKKIPELTKEGEADKVLVPAPLEEKEIDLSS